MSASRRLPKLERGLRPWGWCVVGEAGFGVEAEFDGPLLGDGEALGFGGGVGVGEPCGGLRGGVEELGAVATVEYF